MLKIIRKWRVYLNIRQSRLQSKLRKSLTNDKGVN